MAKHQTITAQLPAPLVSCNTIKDMKGVMNDWNRRSYDSLANPRTQLEESMPDAQEIVSSVFNVNLLPDGFYKKSNHLNTDHQSKLQTAEGGKAGWR